MGSCYEQKIKQGGLSDLHHQDAKRYASRLVGYQPTDGPPNPVSDQAVASQSTESDPADAVPAAVRRQADSRASTFARQRSQE